jgi:hypothetical protein
VTRPAIGRCESFTIPAGGVWTNINAPLDLSSGWAVSGSPDLERTFAVGFLVDADFGAANGSLYLDDFELIESGPMIDVATAPIETIVERLAHRQFDALWTARNKVSGLIPNSSDNVAIGALNTTTGLVWTLPGAVRRGWVTQSDADDYMGQLVTSLNTNRNQTTYLPTRFLDFVSAAPVTDHEECIHCSGTPQLQIARGHSAGAGPTDRRPAKPLQLRRVHDRRRCPAGVFSAYGPVRMLHL